MGLNDRPGSSGSPVQSATEGVAGLTQQATDQQIKEGAPGNYFATAARLKAELDRRAMGSARASSYFVNQNFAVGASVTTSDLRGVNGVPSDPTWVLMEIVGNTASGRGILNVDSADRTPDDFSPRHEAGPQITGKQMWVPLGTGANAGKITVTCRSGLNAVSGAAAWVVGWRR